jgi:hypothetical protein
MGSHSQFGGNFGQQGPSFVAPPPPEKPRPSVADEITTSIFGDPNPSMASSSLAPHHTTMPPFFDSSMYTRPGAHCTAPLDYVLSEDQ